MIRNSGWRSPRLLEELVGSVDNAYLTHYYISCSKECHETQKKELQQQLMLQSIPNLPIRKHCTLKTAKLLFQANMRGAMIVRVFFPMTYISF